MRDGVQWDALDPFARTSTNRLGSDPFERHYESQFVNCDIRTFPMQVRPLHPLHPSHPSHPLHGIRTFPMQARITRFTPDPPWD